VARVENMGANSRTFTLTIPFLNTIDKGAMETWIPGKQFGSGSNWEKLRQDWDTNKTAGQLQHPELGEITCKFQNYTVVYQEKPRNGVIVTVNFIECLPDNDLFTITNGATIKSLTAAGAFADAAIGDLPSVVNPPGMNLQQLFATISSYISQIVNYPGAVASSLNMQINGVLSQIEGTALTVVNAPLTVMNQAQSIVNSNKYQQLGIVNSFKETADNYRQLAKSNNNNSNNVGSAWNNPTNANSFNTTNLATQSNGPKKPTVNVKYNMQNVQRVLFAQQQLFNTSQPQSATIATRNSRTNNSSIQNQIIRKAIVFTQAMIDHYNSLRHVSTSAAVDSLYAYVAALKQIAPVKTVSGKILSFTTNIPMSWIDISKYTNNDIDTVMSLNQNPRAMFFVPTNTTVYYQSDTGY
jgi:hypothetical protein